MKQHIYKVSGMHCASCEILLEKKLLEIKGVKSVDASTSKEEVVLNYENEKPNIHELNKIFKKDGYIFSENREIQNSDKSEIKKGMSPTLLAFDIAMVIIVAFLFLNNSGVSGLLNVSSSSSLVTFLGLGLLAGISSCAALVGGIVLSMSKQWSELYSAQQSTFQKLQPHIMFNVGRIVSYAVLGGILGMIGSKLQISFQFTSFLVIAISFLMIALGLQMLGVKAFRKFQFALPKSITKNIADEKKFSGKYMPFVMGALTFFLPCGFTITAQGMALLSGSAIQGGLITGAFALGTAPALLLIGLSSVKFISKPRLAEKFSKVAGFLVLFFALFNINSQMNVLGFTGFGDLIGNNSSNVSQVDQKDLPPIVNGKQILKMNASASGYSPNYLKVRAGVPVRWEITDKGTSGCTNAIISKSLFPDSIPLSPGQVSVKEFTVQKAGKYKFSCWMGMVTGIIEAVDVKAGAKVNNNSAIQTANAETNNNAKPSSGGSACGGGGGGCGCGGGANIKKDTTTTTAQVQNNIQTIKTIYTANNYLSPNVFEVNAGTKVKLTIDVKDSGRGCGREIMIPGLYNNAIALNAGETITMEFTPTKSGNYDITCGMEMMNFGSIQVN
jgi:sulfite exporter TauE/SafE/copper chaperone CopZ/heme/copper-type cytochrome/quinol oxidase subunit 2